MDAILLIGLFVLAFVGVPIALGLLLYWVPRKLGYPRTGKCLATGFGCIVVTFALYAAFEDKFFTKSAAKALVEEQDLELSDEFDLLSNRSSYAISDHYHEFKLSISEGDKRDAISRITSAPDFTTDEHAVEGLARRRSADRYFGERLVQNYATEASYVREYFEPSQRQGYVPTFRRISISKIGNELRFEDINE